MLFSLVLAFRGNRFFKYGWRGRRRTVAQMISSNEPFE